MITFDMIDNGLINGYVKIREESVMSEKPVCQIGLYWFYFATGDPDEYSMINYLLNHTRKEVVNDICNALQAIFEDDNVSFEYSYYETYLNEKLILNKTENSDDDEIMATPVEPEVPVLPDFELE